MPMIFKEDIISKINIDFGENANNAFEVLKKAIINTDDLNSDRVIRCIVFLSKGNMDDLTKYIKAATTDTRDIMLWAEYAGSDELGNYERLRDFNNPFGENLNNINE